MGKYIRKSGGKYVKSTNSVVLGAPEGIRKKKKSKSKNEWNVGKEEEEEGLEMVCISPVDRASNKNLAENPNDKFWEESEGSTSAAAAASRLHNADNTPAAISSYMPMSRRRTGRRRPRMLIILSGSNSNAPASSSSFRDDPTHHSQIPFHNNYSLHFDPRASELDDQAGGTATRSPSSSSSSSHSPPSNSQSKIETEIEDFLHKAEEQQRKRFVEKYNFEPMKDIPLPGRYEWVPIRSTALPH